MWKGMQLHCCVCVTGVTESQKMNDLCIFCWQTLTGMESMFVNCSKSLPPEIEQKYSQQVLALPNEQYYDQQMVSVRDVLPRLCDEVMVMVVNK